MYHPTLNEKDLLIIQAMRNAADHIESGYWVLDHNVVKPLQMDCGPNGVIMRMVVTLNFAAIRVRARLIKLGLPRC